MLCPKLGIADFARRIAGLQPGAPCGGLLGRKSIGRKARLGQSGARRRQPLVPAAGAVVKKPVARRQRRLGPGHARQIDPARLQPLDRVLRVACHCAADQTDTAHPVERAYGGKGAIATGHVQHDGAVGGDDIVHRQPADRDQIGRHVTARAAVRQGPTRRVRPRRGSQRDAAARYRRWARFPPEPAANARPHRRSP